METTWSSYAEVISHSAVLSASFPATERFVRSCGNVFRDLGFDDEEAENLRIRTLLMLVNMLARAGVRLNIAVQRENVADPGPKSIPDLKAEAA